MGLAWQGTLKEFYPVQLNVMYVCMYWFSTVLCKCFHTLIQAFNQSLIEIIMFKIIKTNNMTIMIPH